MTIGTKSRSASAASEGSFPTPAETPTRSPPGETSRSWLGRRDSSSTQSSSPTSAPNQSPSVDRNSDDVEDDFDFKPFDPRRFTPTLHASLVSEILNLRREVESKSKSIDILERSLDDSRTESEDLGASLSQNTKDTRSLQHQLKLLEGGSSTALTELAKERDEALENITDIRKKFEQTQKKVRSREEDVEKTQSLCDRERESWEMERRDLERKVHVVENRLKVVLNEVAAAQTAGSFNATPKVDGGESSIREGTTGKDSDTGSVYSSSQGRRRTSVTSMSTDDGELHNGRYSVMSVAHGQGEGDGLNLAQELAFDEDEEFVTLDDDTMSESPGALPEEQRPTSAHSQMSHTMGMKARKILGLSMQDRRGSAEADGVSETTKSPTKIPPFSPASVYQDAGIQYSPPLLPKASPPSEMKDSSTLTLATDMISTSCQTVGDLPSPPWTPKADELPSLPPSPIPVQVTMVSAFTQTETPPIEIQQKRMSLSPQDALAPGLDIPTIAIHPPGSEPPSPRTSVVLPPQTKSASCQTNMPSEEGRSIAIQTEEIRIDQRPVKLPASLLPSAIPDLPLANEARVSSPQPYPLPKPIKEEKSIKEKSIKEDKRPLMLPLERLSTDSQERSVGHIQTYPGNNDNGPLSKGSKPSMKRPPRTSSLFAGFEESDEESKGRDMFSDDELFNRPTATYTLRRGKMVSTQHRPSADNTTLPEIEEHLSDAKMQLESSMNNDGAESIASSRGQRSGSSVRQQDIRRAAMITSGAAAHQKRAHSPSDPSTDSGSVTSSIAPPIPIPTRHSSRGFPQNGSEGRQSPTPSFGRNFTDRPRQPVTRKPTLRRVRSATTVSPRSQPDPFGSQSSPGTMSSSFGTDSPRRPSLPFEDITESQPLEAPRRGSTRRDESFSSEYGRERQDSTANSVQQTSVVDAIAQTMIGEWMFKYIRRKAFGTGDSKDNWEGRNADEVSASITNSGVRHKRWVWLAPYERAIMWSSKQPTSGPALMGKSGRKLTIKSVLDVKDDNPLPKGSSPQSQFNRSILVLTPQRALKFTATSVERHYVWLTALSFLSHSSMDTDELASLPPMPRTETASPSPAGLRKNPIRDTFKGLPRAYPKAKRPFGNKPAPVPEIPNGDDNESVLDAAAPPTVPMFSKHNRKRSNTTPRMPTVRNFSGIATIPSSNSGTTVGSFDAFHPPPPPRGINSTRSSFSRRTSEASGQSSAGGTGNFFDAIGTVRMEAFIDQTDANRRGPRSRHRRKPSSQWSGGFSGFSGAYRPSIDTRSEASSRLDDPFRGF